MKKKINKLIGLLIIALLSIVFVIGIFIIKVIKDNETNKLSTGINNYRKQSITAKTFKHPDKAYFPQNELTASVTMYNSVEEEKKCGYNLKLKIKQVI